MYKTICLASLLAGILASPAVAQEQASFNATQVLSEELPNGTFPGGAAAKGKLLRLTKTPSGSLDGRLVTIYADASHTGLVWEPKGGEHAARDIFVRYSDDNGDTWSDPTNISNTATHHSAYADWNGDGNDEPYWGDSEKPNVFSSGSIVVVSWIDAYLPEATSVWGSDVNSAVQGNVSYPDIEVYPNSRVVPFKGVYAAISHDGGSTWAFGDTVPALQLTYGMRDAKQDVNRGAGKKWALTWQEDPMGLQPGSADGPGDGSSGATTSKGTDIWYTYVEDIIVSPLDLRTHRTPLSNQSEYDLTQSNGFPLNPENSGGGGSSSSPSHPDAGSIENHGSSRANLAIVNVGGGIFNAVIAYEETKGIPNILVGKTVQFHSFPYDTPMRNGTMDRSFGQAGAQLSPLLLNSRRARFVTQAVSPESPAIAIFWRQGFATNGGPADIMVRVAQTVEEADLLASPVLNLSTNTPTATSADLLLGSEVNRIEDANAHRALLRGNMLVVGWGYTWNGPLARYTDLANYNFWSRRSLDGGVTWDNPVNVSNINNTRVTMREPRLVGPAKVPGADQNSFITAWGTETNVYDGLEDPKPLDTFITFSRDQGTTFAPVVPLSAGNRAGEFETQIRMNEAVDEIYAVVMSNDLGNKDALFTRSTAVFLPQTIGTILCLGDGTGAGCPCGNVSAGNTGGGCANSTGHGGRLLGSGSTSIMADNLSLQISHLPPNSFALMITSPNFTETSTGALTGDGLLCLGAPWTRMSVYASNGSGFFDTGPGITGQLAPQEGETHLFQLLYRDSASPCSTRFNVTNALQVTFGE